MIRARLFCISVAASFASIACRHTIQPQSRIDWKPCQLQSPGSPMRVGAECATLNVEGASLSIARLRATTGNTAPDPIVFIPGGPGQSARESFTGIAPAFSLLQMHRDIVMLDPRGTSGSQPLKCESLEQIADADGEDERFAKLTRCFAHLDTFALGISTAREVEDLEALRNALGVDKLNLYGGSYGTRVALEYMRTHPDRLRSVVLDGVVAHDSTLGTAHADYAQSALDALIDRCAKQADCAKRFPDLRGALAKLKERLSQKPESVRVDHPKTAKPTTVLFDREKLLGTVRFALYAPETVALLPRLIWRAANDDGLPELVRFALVLGGDIDKVVNPLVNYAVLCREDVPYYKAAEGQPWFFERQQGELQRVCAQWPKGAGPGDAAEKKERKPVVSSVPTLLLSGERDPVTAPHEAEIAAKTLSRSKHLVAPGMGHIVLGRGCVDRIVGDFYASASPETLKTDCIADVSQPPLFNEANGP